jgi:hypothetical protein
MSDDIPLIFALEGATPRAVFLSASGLAHLQQFTTAGWAVGVTASFHALRAINLAEVPAQIVDDAIIINPTLVSCEAQTWTRDDLARIARWKPSIVKVNCAFSDIDPALIQKIAKDLGELGLIVLAAHWRDDNSFRIRSLNRIDRLEALQPPEWPRLNFMACATEQTAQMIAKIGRLHAGQEQRIAQLRISEAVRNEQIARLEAALITAQRSHYFKTLP